jgi:hypothetical protein
MYDWIVLNDVYNSRCGSKDVGRHFSNGNCVNLQRKAYAKLNWRQFINDDSSFAENMMFTSHGLLKQNTTAHRLIKKDITTHRFFYLFS